MRADQQKPPESDELESRAQTARTAGDRLSQSVKILAARLNFASVARGREGIVIKFRDRKKAEELRSRDPRAVRIVDGETILVVDGLLEALLK